jgi:hypothetical protein
MASRIPTSTSVTESAVIEARFGDVWHLIKLENFSDFWSALTKSEFVKGTSPDTDIVKWTFKDGVVLEVKLEEHSVRVQEDLLIPPIAQVVLLEGDIFSNSISIALVH